MFRFFSKQAYNALQDTLHSPAMQCAVFARMKIEIANRLSYLDRSNPKHIVSLREALTPAEFLRLFNSHATKQLLDKSPDSVLYSELDKQKSLPPFAHLITLEKVVERMLHPGVEDVANKKDSPAMRPRNG